MVLKYQLSNAMMRTQRITVRLLICTLLFLNSCNFHSDGELPQNVFSQGFVPLRVDTVAGLLEIDAWKIMEKGDLISLVHHNLALNRLTVISEQTNKVVLFSIDREDAVAQKIIDIPNLRVLDIDKTGEKLLVGMSGQRMDKEGKPREFFHWIAIWNIPSGSLDQCFTSSCIDELTDPDKVAYAYIGAVMDAETVVTYSEDSYLVTKLSSENGGGVALVNSPDADYWWHIGKIAINTHDNQLAIAFEEGRIDIERISGSENLPLKGVEVLEQGDENQLQPVQNAVIDPSGNWLSIIRGKELSIWNVGGWLKNEAFHDQIDDVHGMNFNPSGELLFVAVEDHIMIIGLNEKKVAFEIQTPGITSFNISDDNRLLIWGDENGTVHVLGIPIR